MRSLFFVVVLIGIAFSPDPKPKPSAPSETERPVPDISERVAHADKFTRS